jgi:hypothetical protein
MGASSGKCPAIALSCLVTDHLQYGSSAGRLASVLLNPFDFC